MLICVDLDGTLLDTVPANAASYRAALEELGFTVTDEYYAERCNGGHYTRFLPPLMGGAPSTADVERVHDRKKALYSDFLDAVRPNTALMEILKTMRAAGHDLACVTTGSKQNATEVLEHFGVREWFGLIVTGEDVEKQKPDPECSYVYFRFPVYHSADCCTSLSLFMYMSFFFPVLDGGSFSTSFP